MKTRNLLVAAVMGLGLPAGAQLTLNAGDSYTYQFSTLPFVGIEPSDPRQLFGMAGVVIDQASFGPGDSIRLEMFENSPAESPLSISLASDSLQSFGFGSQFLFGIAASSANHWSDHQGAIRLTELGGSCTVESIGLEYVANRDLTTANVWRDVFTPVPEPGAAALLGMGLLTRKLRRGFAFAVVPPIEHEDENASRSRLLASLLSAPQGSQLTNSMIH